MPRTFVDDNYGTYDIQDEEDVEFYNQVQKDSRLRKCKGCGQKKRLRPGYICDSCATILERGGDLDGGY
jgi:hypothetical protein